VTSDFRVRYEETVAILVEYLPELEKQVADERRWWGADPPAPYVVYEDIFNPYMRGLLDTVDEPSLKRVFLFLEKLCADGDLRTQELIAIAVCESLVADEPRLRGAKRFMGPATKGICEAVERDWKRAI
jgi:hypothetical protein